MRRLLVLLLVAPLLLALPSGRGLPPAQDDAGSGRDAPDSATPDVRVATGVVHQGRLASGDLHDWYAFDAPAGARVHVRVLGGHGCWEIAGADGVALAHACSPAPYVEGEALAVVPAAGTWYLHYENVPLDAYRFSVGIGARPPSPSAEAPSFEGPHHDDAGSGHDAPESRSDVIRLQGGVVYRGRLGALDSEDRADWYSFELTASSRVEVRARGVNLCFSVWTGAGARLGGSCTSAVAPASAKIAFNLPPGIHHLEFLGDVMEQPYTFSFGVGQTPPEPPSPLLPPASASSPLAPAPPAAAWLDAARAGTPLPLALEGETLSLLLRENVGLVAPGAVRDADGAPVDLSDVHPLAGVVRGEPGSWVRVTLQGGEAYGHLSHPRLGVFTLATRVDGSLVALHEDAARALAGIAPRPVDDHAPDSVPLAMGAGGCLRASPQRVAHPLGLATGWPERTFDVAFAVDSAFVAIHGPGWAGRAVAHANSMDGLFDAGMDLRLRVADLHSHAAGAFAGDATDELLVSLSAHYHAAHAALPRENAHLFTGRGLTGAVGQANCIGGAGNDDLAYTVGMADNASALSFLGLRWFPDVDTKIAAHEIAHILSAHHHYANCVERASRYDPRTTLDACTLMFNDVSLLSLQMSAANRLVTRGWAEHADL